MTAPAWYVIRSSNPAARWFNILHGPYTVWHLSYPAMGAALADPLDWPVFGWTLLAFFLGMGISAHCFDLLRSDPLRLGISPNQLKVVGLAGVAGATAIGLWQIVVGDVPAVILIFIPFGILFAVGYGLEWRGLHGDWQFALWWATFPVLVGYFAQGISWNPALPPLLLWAFYSASAQRIISTRSRYLRRETEIEESKRRWMLYPLDDALRALSFSMPLIAAALLYQGHLN